MQQTPEQYFSGWERSYRASEPPKPKVEYVYVPYPVYQQAEPTQLQVDPNLVLALGFMGVLAFFGLLAWLFKS